MATIGTERVLTVHHWNETVFSFTTTRDPGLRFENGHFIMLGLAIDGKPLMRAYSIASANHEEYLEFLSIKVADGPLTSRLQNIKPGDEVLVSRKPTGTLLLHDLKPGKRLYLLSSGTGLAPFMSLIKDPAAYERFEKIILVHGVRYRRVMICGSPAMLADLSALLNARRFEISAHVGEPGDYVIERSFVAR